MMAKMISRFLLLILIFSFSQAYAIKEPKSMAIDRRLGVIVYSPYDVHRFTGYYGYQSSIIFAEDETIETISMGDSIPWQMVPNGNRLFLKPIEQDATTNMTLITNKRVYYFELHAQEATDINEDGLMFAVKFLYPDDQDSASIGTNNASAGPDLTDKSLYNFNYTISGPDIVSPIKIFDDGKFTYFEFKDNESELPAIFYVTSRGTEGLINYRMAGKYLVIESIRERFTLRHDKDIVCVFNENLIAKRGETDKNLPKKNGNSNLTKSSSAK
jgi:type IV secretion system protein VirB9